MRQPFNAGGGRSLGALRPRKESTSNLPLMICTTFATMKFLRSLFTSVWNNAVALVDHPSDGPPVHEYRASSGYPPHEERLYIAWAPGEGLPRVLSLGAER